MVVSSAPAHAQLAAASLELGGDLVTAPTNLTEGDFGRVLRVGFNGTWGRYMLRLSGEMFFPRAEDRTAYVLSARIGKWSFSKVGDYGESRLKRGIGCTVSAAPERGTGWVKRTCAQQQDVVIPAGFVFNSRTLSLGYRQVLNGKYTDEDNGNAIVPGIHAGAPTIAWTKVMGLSSAFALMVDIEAYMYLVGHKEPRFQPGAAISGTMQAGFFYLGPTLRYDLFTGLELGVKMGFTFNLASLL